MLVQAQVVALGKRGDRQSSPSRFHPVTSITHRQEDRRVRLQNRVVSTTARRATRTLSRNEKFEFFWCPSPGGRSVREITSREETERPPENRLGRSQQASASTGSRLPGTESLLEMWLGRSNRSREVWQVPGLREFRFAERSEERRVGKESRSRWAPYH